MSHKIWLALIASTALSFGQMAVQPGYGLYPQRGAYAGAPAQQPGNVFPGTLNYEEAQVLLDNQQVRTGTVLRPAQALATGNGFAEVLLTPGAFLRAGNNSQIRITRAGLADAQAQLDKGTALVEVDQLIQGTNLSVTMNGATARIEKRGLYEFDATQQTVKVLDGEATVSEAVGTKTIGKGDELQLASAKPLKSRGFDLSAAKLQPLYVWSQARSQDESQANVAVAQNVAAYGGWYGAGWYFDPYYSFYAYLPGSGLLYSPFGWGFYSPAFIGYYGLPLGYRRGFGGYAVLHTNVGGRNAHIGGFAGGFHAGGGRR